MQTGIDIIKNSRIRLDQVFLERILSANELKLFKSFVVKKRQQEFVAGRWAAKEAIYKCKHATLSMNQIEILNDRDGKPYVNNAQLQDVAVSISHEKKYTVAVAISQ